MLNPLPIRDLPLDPDDVMTGTCPACKNVVETTRAKVTLSKPTTLLAAQRAQGVWHDVPYVECPTCKEASRKRKQAAGRFEEGDGPRVYVTVKK